MHSWMLRLPSELPPLSSCYNALYNTDRHILHADCIVCIDKYIHTNNCQYIHSFRLFLQRLFKSTTTQRRSRHSMDTVPKFHAEAPQATAREGLAQGPYVAARAGFEPATLWMKGFESTNEPPCPYIT